MTQEKMEGHEPQGHSLRVQNKITRVEDAHMDKQGKLNAVWLSMYIGVELYMRIEKKR